jgi:hypothetical protein
MLEHFFICPYCFQQISVLIDPSESEQHYIEDCEVCCRPIEIRLKLEEQQLVSFEANRSE